MQKNDDHPNDDSKDTPQRTKEGFSLELFFARQRLRIQQEDAMTQQRRSKLHRIAIAIALISVLIVVYLRK